VNYHGVLPDDSPDGDGFLDGNLVSLEGFQRQLRFLKTHYRIIEPEDYRAWIKQGKAVPDRAVLVTCDDGLLNTLTEMFPVLQAEDLRCLFFITGASCRDDPGMLWYEELYHLLRAQTSGTNLKLPTKGQEITGTADSSFRKKWWDAVVWASGLDASARAEWMGVQRGKSNLAPSARSERRWRLLNSCELVQMARAGMSIGAHTLSHPVLSRCSEEEARREIAESKIELERALGCPVWALAYPFGNLDTVGEREVRMARDAGFECAFLNVDGGETRPNPFALGRTHITADMNLAELEAHMTGFHARLQQAIRG